MPYLSHNYRYQPKPKSRSLIEAGLFLLVSALAILFTLFVLGLLSVYAAEATTNVNQLYNYQTGPSCQATV